VNLASVLNLSERVKTKDGWSFTGKSKNDIHGWVRFKKQPSDFSDVI
jgi:hypothetical protein